MKNSYFSDDFSGAMRRGSNRRGPPAPPPRRPPPKAPPSQAKAKGYVPAPLKQEIPYQPGTLVKTVASSPYQTGFWLTREKSGDGPIMSTLVPVGAVVRVVSSEPYWRGNPNSPGPAGIALVEYKGIQGYMKSEWLVPTVG